MKLLFISNVSKRVGSFSIASIRAAKELGYEYHLAASFPDTPDEQLKSDEEAYGIHIHRIDFERNPLDRKNRKALAQVKELIKREGIDAIHCNTPVGGLVGRLAGKKCKVKRVIYQAHGFHFYKGAPKKNWLVYYPAEKWLAHRTDALITINKEDFEIAGKLKLRGHGKVYCVPGVGIDEKAYRLEGLDRKGKRSELGLADDEIMVISAGDLIPRKNYEASIRAVALANDERIHYFICGKGPEKDDLEALAKELGVSERVHFLGFRSDLKELLGAADVFLFTTRQEGLPRSLSEAMASGLPCAVSKIRGNTDLVTDGVNGFLLAPNDAEGFGRALKKLADDPVLRAEMGGANLGKIKEFGIDKVVEKLRSIYSYEFKDC